MNDPYSDTQYGRSTEKAHTQKGTENPYLDLSHPYYYAPPPPKKKTSKRIRLIAELLIALTLIGMAVASTAMFSNYEYTQGDHNGYLNGQRNGYKYGKNGTYNKAFSAGQNQGQQQGYNNGYDVGKQAGYTSGYTSGKQDGYKAGKQAGYTNAMNEESSWFAKNCQINGDGYYEIDFNQSPYECATSGNYSYQDTVNDLASWTRKNCSKDANGHYEILWIKDNGQITIQCY